MRASKNSFGLLFLLTACTAAQAGGSIPLSDVMDQLKDNDVLIAAIDAELKAQNVEAASVICDGARFGGHWTELGGARSVPYECEIGKRTLKIDGTVHLYDQNSAEIDASDEKAPERAFTYKETDLKWKWE
jgi:hypothetical protein